jgi:hypothetical protein
MELAMSPPMMPAHPCSFAPVTLSLTIQALIATNMSMTARMPMDTTGAKMEANAPIWSTTSHVNALQDTLVGHALMILTSVQVDLAALTASINALSQALIAASQRETICAVAARTGIKLMMAMPAHATWCATGIRVACMGSIAHPVPIAHTRANVDSDTQTGIRLLLKIVP